jgi:hypothetical protein
MTTSFVETRSHYLLGAVIQLTTSTSLSLLSAFPLSFSFSFRFVITLLTLFYLLHITTGSAAIRLTSLLPVLHYDRMRPHLISHSPSSTSATIRFPFFFFF